MKNIFIKIVTIIGTIGAFILFALYMVLCWVVDTLINLVIPKK